MLTDSPMFTQDPEQFTVFKQAIEQLLVCPITQKPLEDPHVVEIEVKGQKQVLTISGTELHVSPGGFQANAAGRREITYQESRYQVHPCFDRVVAELLELLNGNEDEKMFKTSLEKILTCSITQELFVAPIITSTGYTYSASAWNSWKAQNSLQDTQRASVTFTYSHALVAKLIEVHQKYYPQQLNSEPPAQDITQETAMTDLTEEQRNCREVAGLLSLGSAFSAGEAGVVMGISWICGGCNNKALALKLAIGGGVGCCIGALTAGIVYKCCTTPEIRAQHYSATLSQCTSALCNRYRSYSLGNDAPLVQNMERVNF